MKIDKIKAEDVFKSYRTLCQTLEEKIKTGNAKKAQIKMWENYFDFEQKGNKYIIKEIYDKPKGFITQYGFITDIEELILNLLVQQKGEKLFIPKSTMFKELCMTNEDYNELRYHIPKLSLFTNIEENEIEEFYDLSRASMVRSVETALDNLEKRKLIFHRNGISLCQIKVDPRTNSEHEYKAKKEIVSYDEYGNPEYDFSIVNESRYIHREANEEEIKQVIRIQREALEELKCESEYEAVKRGKWDRYKSIVNDRLWEEMNVLYTYKCYDIIFNQDHVADFWLKIKKHEIGEMIERAKKINVNNTMQHKLIKNAEDRYEKALENLNTTYRSDDDYVKNVKELVNILISIEKESVKQEVKAIKIKKLSMYQ